MTTTTTERNAATIRLEVDIREAKTNENGTLCNYRTGGAIRPATEDEQNASRIAAETDSGSGVIVVDGVCCYVAE